MALEMPKPRVGLSQITEAHPGFKTVVLNYFSKSFAIAPT